MRAIKGALLEELGGVLQEVDERDIVGGREGHWR